MYGGPVTAWQATERRLAALNSARRPKPAPKGLWRIDNQRSDWSARDFHCHGRNLSALVNVREPDPGGACAKGYSGTFSRKLVEGVVIGFAVGRGVVETFGHRPCGFEVFAP